MNLRNRRVRFEDAELLWRWANDHETRRNSFNKSPISYADHLKWLENQLSSSETLFWIFSDGDRPVGQVRVEVGGQVAEINISVAPQLRGCGYGKSMLCHAIDLVRAQRGRQMRMRASVFGHNDPSLRLFKALGFREIDIGRAGGGERVVVFELSDAPGSEAAE